MLRIVRPLASAIRQRVHAFDPDAAASELLTTERFAAVMLAALATAGLLLAVVGLYGAISHSVRAQRTEIALRIAVGAGLLRSRFQRRRSVRL